MKNAGKTTFSGALLKSLESPLGLLISSCRAFAAAAAAAAPLFCFNVAICAAVRLSCKYFRYKQAHTFTNEGGGWEDSETDPWLSWLATANEREKL
jgi:hypothetical protein